MSKLKNKKQVSDEIKNSDEVKNSQENDDMSGLVTKQVEEYLKYHRPSLKQKLDEINTFNYYPISNYVGTYHGFALNDILEGIKLKLEAGDFESLKYYFYELFAVNLFFQPDHNYATINALKALQKKDKQIMANHLLKFRAGSEGYYYFSRRSPLCQEIERCDAVCNYSYSKLEAIITKYFYKNISISNWWLGKFIFNDLLSDIKRLTLGRGYKYYSEIDNKYKASFAILCQRKEFKSLEIKYFNEYRHHPLGIRLWLMLFKFLVEAKKTTETQDIMEVYLESTLPDNLLYKTSGGDEYKKIKQYKNSHRSTTFVKHFKKQINAYLKGTEYHPHYSTSIIKNINEHFSMLDYSFQESNQELYWTTIQKIKKGFMEVVKGYNHSKKNPSKRLLQTIIRVHLQYLINSFDCNQFKNSQKMVSKQCWLLDKKVFPTWSNLFEETRKISLTSFTGNFYNQTFEEVLWWFQIYFNHDKIFSPHSYRQIEKFGQLYKTMGNHPDSPSYYQDLAQTTLDNELFLNLEGEIELDVIEVNCSSNMKNEKDDSDDNERDNDNEKANENQDMNDRFFKNGFVANPLPPNLDIYFDNHKLRQLKYQVLSNTNNDAPYLKTINDFLEKHKIEPIKEIKYSPRKVCPILFNSTWQYKNYLDATNNNCFLYYGHFVIDLKTRTHFNNDLIKELEAHQEEYQAQEILMSGAIEKNKLSLSGKSIPKISQVVFYEEEGIKNFYIKYDLGFSLGIDSKITETPWDNTHNINQNPENAFCRYLDILSNANIISKMLKMIDPIKVGIIRKTFNQNFYMRDAFNHRINDNLIIHLPSLMKLIMADVDEIKGTRKVLPQFAINIGFYSPSSFPIDEKYKNPKRKSTQFIRNIGGFLKEPYQKFFKNDSKLYRMYQIYPQEWIEHNNPEKTLVIR